MKKLMIFVMLVVAMSIDAQTIMFKAEKIEATDTKDWNDAEISDPTGTILLSHNDEVVSVFWPEATLKFYIRSSEATQDETSKHILYQCVDSRGVECMVGVSWWKDNETAYAGLYMYRWRILYSNQWFGFYCNPIGTDAPQTTPKKQTPTGQQV